MSDLVSQYLNEIGLVPLLDSQKERELSQAIEQGRVAQEQKDTALAMFPEVVAQVTSRRYGTLNGGGKSTAKPTSRGRSKTSNTKAISAKARSKLTPPTKAQVRAWDRAIKEAAAAKDHFIRANLRLVVSVARRYPLPPGMELLDLIQEGNLGLEHAVDKFDWRKGFKFSTYATFWIRQAIGRALDQRATLVRLPGDRAAALRAALRESSGDSSDLDPENAMLHRLTTPAALDRTVGDDGTTELVDLLADAAVGPEDKVLDTDHNERLFSLVNEHLDDRSLRAIEYRLGLFDGKRRSYREVGEELEVTAEAARRLVKRSLETLRRHMPEDLLEDYPDLLEDARANYDAEGVPVPSHPEAKVA